MEKGNYPTVPGSEFSKLKAYGDHYNEQIAEAMEMKTVFLLKHVQEDGDEGIASRDIMTLGIYSTIVNAKTAIDFYKTLPGFKDFSDDCFYLDEYELNKKVWDEGFVTKVWNEGFVTVKGIQERREPKTPEEIEYVKSCLRERIREKQEELKKLQEKLNKYDA